MTRDSSGPVTLAISVQQTACNKVIMRLEKVLKFETSVRKTPWI